MKKLELNLEERKERGKKRKRTGGEKKGNKKIQLIKNENKSNSQEGIQRKKSTKWKSEIIVKEKTIRKKKTKGKELWRNKKEKRKASKGSEL